MKEWITYLSKIGFLTFMGICAVVYVTIFIFRARFLSRCSTRFKRLVFINKQRRGKMFICAVYLHSIRSWFRGRIDQSYLRDIRNSAPRTHIIFADAVFILSSLAMVLLFLISIPIILEGLDIKDFGLGTIRQNSEGYHQPDWFGDSIFAYLRFALFSGPVILMANFLGIALFCLLVSPQRAHVIKQKIRGLLQFKGRNDGGFNS